MKKAILITSAVMVLGAGIYFYILQQKKLLSQFKWELAGVKISKLSGDEVLMSLTIKFISAADLEAQVNSMSLDVSFNGKSIGTIEAAESFLIPSHGSSFIPLTIKFNPGKLFSNLLDMLFSTLAQKDGNVSFDGSAKISSGIISVKVPIHFTTSIKSLLVEEKK